MFQQNVNKQFLVCVNNSQNIIPFFHKNVISHDSLKKIYPNLTRTCKNKYYEQMVQHLFILPMWKKINVEGLLDLSKKENSSGSSSSTSNLLLF